MLEETVATYSIVVVIKLAEFRNKIWNCKDLRIFSRIADLHLQAIPIRIGTSDSINHHGFYPLKELQNCLSRIIYFILFSKGLYKSAFSTDFFGKLVFCLSVLCWIEFDVTSVNVITFRLQNHCLYKYQVLCVFILTYF